MMQPHSKVLGQKKAQSRMISGEPGPSIFNNILIAGIKSLGLERVSEGRRGFSNKWLHIMGVKWNHP